MEFWHFGRSLMHFCKLMHAKTQDNSLSAARLYQSRFFSSSIVIIDRISFISADYCKTVLKTKIRWLLQDLEKFWQANLSCRVCKGNWIVVSWDLMKSGLTKYIFFARKIYLWLWEIREVARYPSDVVAIQFSEENTTWQRPHETASF